MCIRWVDKLNSKRIYYQEQNQIEKLFVRTFACDSELSIVIC